MRIDLQENILSTIDSLGDASFKEIAANYPFDDESLSLGLHWMIAEKKIRMKEDEVEHDWKYRRRINHEREKSTESRRCAALLTFWRGLSPSHFRWGGSSFTTNFRPVPADSLRRIHELSKPYRTQCR